MNGISIAPDLQVSWVTLGLIALVGVPLGIVLLIYLIVPAARGLGWLVVHIAKFIGAEVSDLLRLIGALIVAIVLVPITLVNVILGRWSASAHYGRAIEIEGRAMLGALYRVLLGNPARLLMLTPLTEGLEQRIPQAMLAAPAADTPSRRTGQFEGYTIIGSLPGGGSGSRLFVAVPDKEKLAAFARAGQTAIDRVVIKSFSLLDGSSLPQIVRENRALPAAKRLGLILEHQLTDDKFFYVTRYVPGDALGVVTTRLHGASPGDGLSDDALRQVVTFCADLLRTLELYHASGLWHKDVKPDNIIVSDGRAHLVDFGLVTPLRSSITLTTHGTEYFRDPEMVRLALRGVKVHEVDGAKFDIYAAGAVLYAMLENSFPAHGGLSRITRRCPESLRWVVRRAMADYDKRYATAGDMLRDVEAVLAAPDAMHLRPADLPSFAGPAAAGLAAAERGFAPDLDEVAAPSIAPAFAGPARGSPVPPFSPNSPPPLGPSVIPNPGAGLTGPVLRVTNWWSGTYSVERMPSAAAAGANIPGRSAAAQLARQRRVVAANRARAQARVRAYRSDFPAGVNAGVVIAVIALLLGGGLLGIRFIDENVSAPTLAELTNSGAVTIDLGDSHSITIPPAGVPVEAVPVRTFQDLSKHPPALPATPTSPPSPALPPLSGSVLVVRDEVTFSKTAAPIVDAQVESLRAAGLTLLGNPRMTPPDDADLAMQQEDLLARFRSAVGIRTFRTSEAALAVRNWLSSGPDVLAIVWFGRAEDGTPHAWIIGSSAAPQATLTRIAAHLRAAQPPEQPAPTLDAPPAPPAPAALPVTPPLAPLPPAPRPAPAPMPVTVPAPTPDEPDAAEDAEP